jgi:import inner membrane translocase subunit TIM17
MFQEVRAKAPVTGGQFAAWGGVFSICDCTLVKLRGKEDPINSILSGGITGGLLAARTGPQTMIISATIGAMILGMIEGFSLLLQRVMSNYHDPNQMPPPDDPRALQANPSGGKGHQSSNRSENMSSTSAAPAFA